MSVKLGLGGSTHLVSFPISPLRSPTSPPVLPPKRFPHVQLSDARCRRLLPALPLLSPAVVVPGCSSGALGGPCCPGDKANLSVALNRPSVTQRFRATIYQPQQLTCLFPPT